MCLAHQGGPNVHHDDNSLLQIGRAEPSSALIMTELII
jgi:hypothetical protein